MADYGQGGEARSYGTVSTVSINAARLESATKQKIETRLLRTRDEGASRRERNAGAGTQTRRMCANNLSALAAFGIAGGNRVGL